MTACTRWGSRLDIRISGPLFDVEVLKYIALIVWDSHRRSPLMSSLNLSSLYGIRNVLFSNRLVRGIRGTALRDGAEGGLRVPELLACLCRCLADLLGVPGGLFYLRIAIIVVFCWELGGRSVGDTPGKPRPHCNLFCLCRDMQASAPRIMTFIFHLMTGIYAWLCS